MDEITIEHLRSAVNMCGFDFDDIVSSHTNKRAYTDMRAIIWHILQSETGASYAQIGKRFKWNRATVFYSLNKAHELREYDREFCNLYDSVYSYYMHFESTAGNEENGFESAVSEGVGESLAGEAR